MITSNRFSGIQEKAEPVIRWIMSLLETGHPLANACSMGKDSTVVLVLMLEAITRVLQKCGTAPRCYVTHSDTLIENPAMSFYAQAMLDQLEVYIVRHQLPIEIVRVTPALSATFAYATIGRGKLPRFVNSEHRECSVDWKVKPQARALKNIIAESATVSAKPIISLHGSRLSESLARGQRMVERGDGNTALVLQANGSYSNAPIADWEVEDVWELLMSCDVDRGGVYTTFTANFQWCLKLYKDANEGTCAIVTGDGGNRSSCGSRYGCGWCTVSSRTGDRSMEALIASGPEYAYLSGINRFSNLLVNTQYDLDKRDWLGRTLSKAGYVRIRPDNYSPRFRRQLLRYLITLDVMEEERAEEHNAALVRGEIEDTPDNGNLCSPQFQFITPQLLLAIDFAWSIQRDFEQAFPAIGEWYQIRSLGRRYVVPESAMVPPVTIPEARWYHAGTFDHPWMIDGLRDPIGEAINLKRRPGVLPYMTCNDHGGGNEKRRIAYHETANELHIDPEEAGFFVHCEFDEIFFKCLNMDSKDSLIYLLDRGLVKLGVGMAAKYDFLARRADFYTRLKATLNVGHLTPVLLSQSISNQEHNAILQSLEEDTHHPDGEDPQRDLFDAA